MNNPFTEEHRHNIDIALTNAIGQLYRHGRQEFIEQVINQLENTKEILSMIDTETPQEAINNNHSGSINETLIIE